MGSKYLIMSTLDFNNLSIGQVKDLNEISDQLKPEFNKLSGTILSSNHNTLVWALHPLVSRNPYHSDIYIHLCQIILAKKYIDEGASIGAIIAVNRQQKNILSKYIKEKNAVCQVTVNWSAPKIIYKWYANYTIFKRVIYYIASKVRKRTNLLRSATDIILLDTFILQNSLKGGKYIDRYYPGILDHLRDDQMKKIFWVPTISGHFSSKQLHSLWKNSNEQIVYKHDYLGARDYYNAFMMLLSMTFMKNEKYSVRGMDITDMIHTVYKQGKVTASSFDGLLNFFFMKKLRSKNIDLRLVVDWNENQPIDKGLIKGVKTFYPEVRTKGYQGYIISPDYNVYIQPTDYEVDAGLIPDEICVVGNGLQDQVCKYTQKITVSIAPAFRFSNVYTRFKREDYQKTVMLALPIGFRESYDIINLVSQAIKAEHENLRIQIKPHPVLKIDKLIKKFGKGWRKEFTVVEGDFNRLVSGVDLLIGSTSTTLLETISRGIPVIVVGSQNGLTQNPIPKTVSEKVWSLCYTPEEMGVAINYFLNCTQSEVKDIYDIGNTTREQYFERIVSKEVRKFLELD
jgi:hypothetical protein